MDSQKVRKARGQCEWEGCVWAAKHDGPHGVKCVACEGDGIVLMGEDWVRCRAPACKGRGWTDISRKLIREAADAG